MKKIGLFGAVVLSLILAGSGLAVDFNVTNDTELRIALNTAATNGLNDTINIAAGTYDASTSTFSYTPAAGNNSLTIVGAGAGSTILDGKNLEQVMNIDTTGVVGGDSNSHITVTGITFENGDTPGGAFEDGGGLCIETNQANITVEDCEFNGNTADVYGGAVYARSFAAGTVTFANNIFDGNTANVNGGGVYGRSSTGNMTFTNNIFDGNTANQGGGVYGRSSTGNMTFTNNTFNGNTAQNVGGGGAASRSQGTITFTNNTSLGNTADNFDGGGFHITLELNTSIGNIYNNIVWNNTASGNGDDIYVEDNFDGDLVGASVNLYNNDYGPDPDPNDFGISDGDNLSRGSNINTDPLLVDPASEDFHLQTTSPCINAGTAAAPSLPPTDCDGEQRNSGSAPDIGADEVPATSGDGGGFCFIATAAYGSVLSNEVTIFKQFRDEFLLTNELGRSFVSAYYSYSPRLADCIAKHPMGRKMVRIGLYPILELSKWFVEENDSKQPSKEAE